MRLGAETMCALVGLLLPGCFASHPADPPARGPCGDGAHDYAPPPCPGGPRRCVDILFALDGRASMVEEQRSLFDQVEELVQTLATGDLDGDGSADFSPPDDLHLGVVTADLGTAGHSVPTCLSPVGGDGAIIGRGRAGRLSPICGLDLPAHVTWRRGDDLDEARLHAACMLAVGAFGCEYAQPLDAALEALTRSDARLRFAGGACGRADTDNAGFLRQDSVLLVIVVSDHDDCSVADGSFFADADPRALGAGRFCSRDETRLRPVGRYVDGFAPQRSDPRDLLFAVLAGVPPALLPGRPTDYAGILAAEAMQIRVDPEDPTRLARSCEIPGWVVAFPPRRLVEVAAGLEGAGAAASVASLCEPSLRPALDALIQRLP